MAQITFFSQLSEVQLNDWAMQASFSLVKGYSANENYGNRQTWNSDELEDSFNDYFQQRSENATFFNNNPDPEYVGNRQNIQKEFSAKIASFDAKIDALEARTTKLKGKPFSANTKLSGEQISYFDSELSEKPISIKNFPQEKKWKSSIQTMNLENIASDRTWGFSNIEKSPVEVIQEQVIQTTKITFTQLVYNNDCLNIGLFWLNSYSIENGCGSLVGFQTAKPSKDRLLMHDYWEISTNYHDNSHFEWNRFMREGAVINPQQKADVQVLNLGVTLAFHNYDSPNNLGNILVDIKLN